ncbi:MAG: response regulator transcription factor [Candidatus Dormibacteraceae bacterium]
MKQENSRAWDDSLRRILVVDSDKSFRSAAVREGSGRSYQVWGAGSGEEALGQFDSKRAAVTVLAVDLPDISGLEVCRCLRQRQPQVLIIFTSSNKSEDEMAIGLEAGGDDYLFKPLSAQELMTRVEAHLHRRRLNSSSLYRRLEFGELSIDIGERRLLKANQEVELTSIEFDILAILADRAGEVISRERIMNLAWGYQYPIDSRVVDVHIRNLRRKIEAEPSQPTHIVAAPGIGYRLADAFVSTSVRP